MSFQNAKNCINELEESIREALDAVAFDREDIKHPRDFSCDKVRKLAYMVDWKRQNDPWCCYDMCHFYSNGYIDASQGVVVMKQRKSYKTSVFKFIYCPFCGSKLAF